MRAALVSFGLAVVVVGMLAVRGISDWSRPFTVVWYSAVILATLFGLVGVGVAIAGRGAAAERRGLVLALSLPALCIAAGVAFLIAVIVGSGVTS